MRSRRVKPANARSSFQPPAISGCWVARRQLKARFGGRVQIFGTARDYFAALFDHGVTPLRLATDEERNKLNEMLRTSMTGGISRSLTSELRSFLLKEETGLADTLQRMKANLDACRRTRTEVQEAQRLEREIGGVFEAGQTMFAAAFHATRERADELRRRLSEAEEAQRKARERLAEAEEQLASAAGIQAIPTLMVFKKGHLVFNNPGMIPPAALEDLISQVRALDIDAEIAKQQPGTEV